MESSSQLAERIASYVKSLEKVVVLFVKSLEKVYLCTKKSLEKVVICVLICFYSDEYDKEKYRGAILGVEIVTKTKIGKDTRGPLFVFFDKRT